jgi:hypothetical protein
MGVSHQARNKSINRATNSWRIFDLIKLLWIINNSIIISLYNVRCTNIQITLKITFLSTLTFQKVLKALLIPFTRSLVKIWSINCVPIIKSNTNTFMMGDCYAKVASTKRSAHKGERFQVTKCINFNTCTI